MTADIFNVYIIGFAQVFLQTRFSRDFLKSGISEKRCILLAAIIGAAVSILSAEYPAEPVVFVLLLASGTLIMKPYKKDRAIKSGAYTEVLCRYRAAKVCLFRKINYAAVKDSAFCAVTSAVIMQLCFGICACIECMLLKFALDPFWAVIITAAGNILPLAMSYACYKIIALKMTAYTAVRNSPAAVIFPLILIFGLDLFINKFFYGNTVSTENMPPVSVHAGLLAVRILCLASVMSVIWAYNKLIISQLAESGYKLCKQYAERSRALYDSTALFRHDFKNHLLVIGGLIDKKEYDKARKYTENLCGQIGGTFFGYATGRLAADVILGEKLCRLDGIDIKCSLKIPDDFKIDDIDLCVIISNAVDNAVNACNRMSGGRYIEISCRRTADMLLIEFENSYDGKPFSYGTGLAGIKAAAGKYNGRTFISTDKNVFKLKLLFNIRPV